MALPPAVAAAIWSRLPLAERVAVVPLVNREWLEASRGPDAPFQDFEVRRVEMLLAACSCR
jgi:hypothetical protein